MHDTFLKELRLGDVRPNRFRLIDEYILDAAKIASLKASIENTDFWVGLTVRNTDDGYELLYGHHRLAAAIEALGEDYRHPFLIRRDVPDYMAIRYMADENSDAWSAPVAHTTLVVKQARDYLDGLLDKYPTWEVATGAAEFRSPRNLIEWFGPDHPPTHGGGAPGPLNYAQCVKRGVGREVIKAFLGGAFARGSMVEKGLNMAGPSIKQRAALAADAAEARHKAEQERTTAAETEAKEKTKAAAELQAQSDHFAASIIPADWNMAQATAFKKAVLTPLYLSRGGLSPAEQAQLVRRIDETYKPSSNGVDPRRKGQKSQPPEDALTAKNIAIFVHEYMHQKFNPKFDTNENPNIEAVAKANAAMEAALKAIRVAGSRMLTLRLRVGEMEGDATTFPSAPLILFALESFDRERAAMLAALRPTTSASSRKLKAVTQE